MPSVPASRHFRSTYSAVDFWIVYKNVQIHAMRATFHIGFSVRIRARPKAGTLGLHVCGLRRYCETVFVQDILNGGEWEYATLAY